MEDKKFWICLNLLGIGSVKLNKLLEYFGTVEKIFSSSENELKKSGLSEKLIEKILNWEKIPWKKEIEKANSLGIEIITLNDKKYPTILKEISTPPLVLYCKGSFTPSDNLAIAIVGTRNPSFYGIKMAERFSYELSSLGFTIVSGLARGIDTYAHIGALKAKGRTIGVLGSGFLHFYPEENKEIGEKISYSGAVISEFPLDTKPNRENFPRRNRIISGLSKGVLVIEAGHTSGALITANFALEQNREVFALPGEVGHLTSAGTHKLLKEGAKLVEKVEDILEELNLEIKKKKLPQKNEIQLSKEEKEIFEIIGENTNLEEIIAKTSIPANDISTILLNLELKGLIKSLPGKFYQKI